MGWYRDAWRRASREASWRRAPAGPQRSQAERAPTPTVAAVPLPEVSFVAVDVETTGLSPEQYADRMVEIGAVRFTLDGLQAHWVKRLWPGCPIHPGAQEVHGLTLTDLMQAPTFDRVADQFLDFVGGGVVVMHNAGFDRRFLDLQLAEAQRDWDPLTVDTLTLLRRHFSLPSNRLSSALTALRVEASASHSALGDAQATAHLLCRIIGLLSQRHSLSALGDLIALQGNWSYWSAAPLRLPAEIHRLIRHRVPVQVSYQLDAETKTWSGVLIQAAMGSDRSYYSLEFPSGSRICLRSDRVRSIRPM